MNRIAHRSGVSPEDAAFVEAFFENPEFRPDDAAYAAWLSFNMRGVERGRELVRFFEVIRPVTNCRVLDVGTGSAGVAIAFAQAGARISAVEIDPRRYRWAEARIGGHGVAVDLSKASVEALPYPDASFDIVIFDSVIEHVANPDKGVSEICRVLSPGGLVYVVAPNRASILTIWSDPHYHMLGVILLPPRLGRWYVEKMRRNSRGYWVNRVPTRRWLRREFADGGVSLESVPPTGLEKLTEPSTIRDRRAEQTARLAKQLHATGLLRRLVLSQYPTLLFLGTQRRGIPDRS